MIFDFLCLSLLHVQTTIVLLTNIPQMHFNYKMKKYITKKTHVGTMGLITLAILAPSISIFGCKA